MRAVPIRYVRDVPAATRFYETLGLEVTAATRPGPRGVPGWVELGSGEAATFALHYDVPDRPPSGLELGFEASEPLEAVVERLRAAGYDTTAIVDESYGRSFTVRDPDGQWIQVTEYDRALYT